MAERPARAELAYARIELRFEAIYYGVLCLLGLGLVVRRLDLDPATSAVGAVGAALACAGAFSLSVRSRVPEGEAAPLPDAADVRADRARSEHSVRTMPLALVLALLAFAGPAAPAVFAVGCLAGWAAAAAIGFVLVRRWEREHGRRAVSGGGRIYAA